MKLFRRHTQKRLPSFGLHIEPTVVRAALLRPKQKGRSILQSAIEVPMPEGAIEAGIIRDTDRVTATIKELLAHSGHHHFPKYVIAGIPDEHGYVLTVTLVKKDTSELEESLRWEVTQHVPFAVDELYMDWTLIESVGDQETYQIAAAPKEIVLAYTSAITKAGLIPIGLEISALAALRALIIPDASATVVVSLGWNSSTLLLVTKRGIPLSLNSQNFCGSRLTALLTEQLKLKPSEAEKAKSVCGLDPSCSQGVVRHALWPEFKLLVEDCLRLTQYASELDPKQPCTHLLLTGSHSAVKFLPEELRLKTQLAALGTELESIHVPSERRHRMIAEHDEAAYTTALGLASAQQ